MTRVYSDLDWAQLPPVCEESPHFLYLERNAGTVKLSDFLTRPKLHGTELYSLVLEPVGVEDSLAARLPVAGMAEFVLDRESDFDERDRSLLDALSPHLVRLHRTHELRGRLRAALALHESARAAVVLLEPDGGIAFASTAARELIARYFGKSGAVLPEPMTSWLVQRRRNGAEPLCVEAGDRTLVVELVDDALLLEERRPLPQLTPREREILELVAEGRSNGEIAERLWISLGTVSKHLDNIYAKLGVHTRTAAAALLREH